MTRIDTEIESTAVEIDGVEYPVAARTVDVVERLTDIQRKKIPEYKKCIEAVEILLGTEAAVHLFSNGRNENIDRIERIFSGVVKAFNYNRDRMEQADTNDRMAGVATALAPATEFIKGINALKDERAKTGIHRPK